MTDENKMALDALKQITGYDDDSIKMVQPSDVIKVRECNHCGNCCTYTNVLVTPYDFYRMSGSKNVQASKVFESLDSYYGQNSYLPVNRIQEDKNSGFCPFLKFKDGDLVCELGDDHKPLVCAMQEVSVAQATSGLDFQFVADRNAPDSAFEVDIEDFLKRNDINTLKFANIRISSDGCNAKYKEVLVSDYIKERLDNNDDVTLSHLVEMYIHKYIDMKTFVNFNYLIAHSNIDFIGAYEPKRTTGMLLSLLTALTLIYPLNSDDCKKPMSFKEQSIAQLKYLQKNPFPALREAFFRLDDAFDICSDIYMRSIIDKVDKDYKIATEEFENYLDKNVKPNEQRTEECKQALNFLSETVIKQSDKWMQEISDRHGLEQKLKPIWDEVKDEFN